MSIDLPQGPSDGLMLIGKALNDLGLGRRGDNSPVEVSRPLPVYILGLTEIDGDFLARAKRRAWRYLVTGDRVLAADVVAPGRRTPKFGSVMRGDLPPRLLEACDRAAESYGSRAERFEARVLEIPALYVVALWVHGQEGTFWNLLELREAQALERIPRNRFVDIVNSAAERLRASPGSSLPHG